MFIFTHSTVADATVASIFMRQYHDDVEEEKHVEESERSLTNTHINILKLSNVMQ